MCRFEFFARAIGRACIQTFDFNSNFSVRFFLHWTIVFSKRLDRCTLDDA